jgi:hypothetical protein
VLTEINTIGNTVETNVSLTASWRDGILSMPDYEYMHTTEISKLSLEKYPDTPQPASRYSASHLHQQHSSDLDAVTGV